MKTVTQHSNLGIKGPFEFTHVCILLWIDVIIWKIYKQTINVESEKKKNYFSTKLHVSPDETIQSLTFK